MDPTESESGEHKTNDVPLHVPTYDKEPPRSDSLTYTQDVACGTISVPCTVTNQGKAVEKCIERHTSDSMFGLDIEWRPNRRKGEDNKTALLQISSPTECLLVQLLHIDYMPDSLKNFLKDPTNFFAGVGISEDDSKLARDHGLVCKSLVELKNYGGSSLSRVLSLKDLPRQVLYLSIPKNRDVTLSDWAQLHLTRQQVDYACMDTWISCAVYKELKKSP
ncbi:hypothetical protein R1flu_013376 [Riccia fluitans]|uniref:3'-5' exonuclease domain-containing protein n=1 Tax=Riccia fluitans TaxID=41844 RepID=A0ABD1YDU6_9MARC